MPKIANAAFFPAGTISIGADEYTAAITGAVLTPTTPTAAITDISGTTTHVAGTPVWALQLNFSQDLATASSLSQYLIANAGTKKAVTYKPQAGATSKSFALNALILPAPIGGTGGAVASSQVTLPIDGQPTIT